MSKKPKRVFLSLPMSGRSDEDVLKDLKVMRGIVRNSDTFAWGAKPIDNFDTEIPQQFVEAVDRPSLLYLGKAIQIMSSCDAILMGYGWNMARGCRAEHQIALDYGIPVFRVEDFDTEGGMVEDGDE